MLGLALMETPAPFTNAFCDFRKPRELGLTHRELQIVQLLRAGLQTKEIAGRLGLQAGTVNTYLRDLYTKIGVGSRLELGLWIAQNSHIIPLLPLPLDLEVS